MDEKLDAKIVLELQLRNITADVELGRSMIEPYDGDPSMYAGERRVSEGEVLDAIKNCDRSDRGVREMLSEISKKIDNPVIEDACIRALQVLQ